MSERVAWVMYGCGCAEGIGMDPAAARCPDPEHTGQVVATSNAATLAPPVNDDPSWMPRTPPDSENESTETPESHTTQTERDG